MFRLGRALDSWRSAQKSINLLDPVLQVTLTCMNINKAFFLLVDHYLWLARVGLVKTDNKKWDNTSSRFYLASLFFATARDIYALEVEIQKVKNDQNKKHDNFNFSHYLYNVAVILKTKPDILVDLTKNLCDIFIPASRLGFVKVSDGTMGALGTISSLLAVLQIASPKYKLTP